MLKIRMSASIVVTYLLVTVPFFALAGGQGSGGTDYLVREYLARVYVVLDQVSLDPADHDILVTALQSSHILSVPYLVDPTSLKPIPNQKEDLIWGSKDLIQLKMASKNPDEMSWELAVKNHEPQYDTVIHELFRASGKLNKSGRSIDDNFQISRRKYRLDRFIDRNNQEEKILLETSLEPGRDGLDYADAQKLCEQTKIQYEKKFFYILCEFHEKNWEVSRVKTVFLKEPTLMGYKTTSSGSSNYEAKEKHRDFSWFHNSDSESASDSYDSRYASGSAASGAASAGRGFASAASAVANFFSGSRSGSDSSSESSSQSGLNYSSGKSSVSSSTSWQNTSTPVVDYEIVPYQYNEPESHAVYGLKVIARGVIDYNKFKTVFTSDRQSDSEQFTFETETEALFECKLAVASSAETDPDYRRAQCATIQRDNGRFAFEIQSINPF